MICNRECESILIEYGDNKIKNAPFCRLFNIFVYFYLSILEENRINKKTFSIFEH